MGEPRTPVDGRLRESALPAAGAESATWLQSAAVGPNAAGDGVLDLRFRGALVDLSVVRSVLESDPDDFCCGLTEPDGSREPSPNCLEREEETEASCEAECRAGP